VRRLSWPLAALALATMLAACGSSRGAQPYSGRLYSVAQVERAFASLGVNLHRAPTHENGVQVLLNKRGIGPEHLYGPPGSIRVVVATSRDAGRSTSSVRPHGLRVMRYANVTVYAKPYFTDDVRGSMAALRWASGPNAREPGKRLIVLADSIGGIRLFESRKQVERRFGPGIQSGRGVFRYLGGHLIVGYEFHDGIYNYVTYLATEWGGYRVAGSGIHVGSPRQDLRRLYVSCVNKIECLLQAGPWPDPLGTSFVVRRGKVVEIDVGRLA
jgi:hypothetical protein